VNAPGSWHDSRVAFPIYEKLENKTPDGFYLVADTAFPRGTLNIHDRIQAPLKSGQRWTGTKEQLEEQLEFNRQLLSFRQTAEWGNRALQGSFGRLRVPLDANDPEARGNLIEICIRLHNLRTRMVGINQIAEVYVPEWNKTDKDVKVWDAFENMLFSDQRANDRVSRYHIYADIDE
jgi:hypothetical protein